MADETGLAVQQAQQAVAKLEGLGLVAKSKVKQGARRSDRMHIHWDAVAERLGAVPNF